MTVMELLRRGTSTIDGGPALSGLRRTALAGAGAAAMSAAGLVLPALVVWVAAPQSTVSWTTALGFGASLWLLGTGAHLSVGAAHLTVVPLLFFGLSVVGGTVAAGRAVREPARARTIVHAHGLVHGPLARALGAWATGYAACAALWSVLAFAAGPVPVLPTLVLPVLVVPAACGILALAWLVHRRPELAGPRVRRPAWVPDAVRRGLRPGLEGAATLLAAGMVLCVVMVVSHFSRVSHLQSGLSPDLIGGVLLAIGQVLVLPNLALWAVSFCAGTGFSAVQGALATWTGNRTSLLPMVPVFGALPEPGAFPAAVPALGLLPVGVGVLVGWRALRSVARLSTGRTKLYVVATAAVVAAGSLGLLDVLGGGSLGVSRLSDIGAPAGAMSVALLGELSLGAGLVLAWDRWKLRG